MNLGLLLAYCQYIRRHIGVTSNIPGICRGFSFAVNVDKLVSTSNRKGVSVARLDCWYDTNKLQNVKERYARCSHFDPKAYIRHTDLCVGASVALRNWNILPQAGLYNGSIRTLVEIVYKDNPIGPNDKQHCHLPDYIVVDFPHLILPPNLKLLDTNHPTVKHQHFLYLMLPPLLILFPSSLHDRMFQFR